MSETLYQCLDIFITEDTLSTSNMSISHLIMDWFEGFDHQFDGNIKITIKYLLRISCINEKRPFLQVYDFIFQT